MLLEGQFRNSSGCAISGIFSKSGERIAGDKIITSIATMHDRSNGLGGGFAGYGIYPEYKDYYAFHIFYNSLDSQMETEKYLREHFEIVSYGEIPVKKMACITDEPLIWRYFLNPISTKIAEFALDEREYVARCVIFLNTHDNGAYVFSSGKNMGVFKAVGFPEDVGEYYMLDTYKGYCWTAHGRYPTNTPGWWGGAHPFALLDYSIVHNGEISSYDANRRSVEMFGYKCSLLTDTEAITYIIDYLHRKQGLNFTDVASVIAAPFWKDIEKMEPEAKAKYTYLRNVFSSMLITGPFSILLGYEGGMMALNDRLKLRSMVVAEKDDMFYVASEECAIRVLENNPDKIWAPSGSEAVIVELYDISKSQI